MIVLAEGFDWCSSSAQLNGRGTVTYPSGGGNVLLITGALGTGQALELDPTSPSTVVASLIMPFDNNITTGRVVIHARVRIRNAFHNTATVLDFIQVRNTAASVVCAVGFNSTAQTLHVMRGSTTLFSVPDALILGTWAHWIFDFTIHSSAGSVNIYKDGELFASETGLNTLGATGDLGFLVLRAGESSANTRVDIDDVAVDDAAPRGQLRVTYHPVDSDVGTPDWTPSAGATVFGVMDEAPNTTDTDYAASGVTGDATRHGITPSLAGKRIDAVQPIVVARVVDPAVSKVSLRLHSDTQDDGGKSTPEFTTAYRGYVGVLSTNNPATGQVWAVGELDAAEITMTHEVSS